MFGFLEKFFANCPTGTEDKRPAKVVPKVRSWVDQLKDRGPLIDLGADTGVIQTSRMRVKHKSLLKLERVIVNGATFTRRRCLDVPFGVNGQPVVSYLNRYDYWCPKCGFQLTDGPTGGVAINAVCETCKVNYGCLPGYLGES